MTEELSLEELIKLARKVQHWARVISPGDPLVGYYEGVYITVRTDPRYQLYAEMEGINLAAFEDYCDAPAANKIRKLYDDMYARCKQPSYEERKKKAPQLIERIRNMVKSHKINKQQEMNK